MTALLRVREKGLGVI